MLIDFVDFDKSETPQQKLLDFAYEFDSSNQAKLKDDLATVEEATKHFVSRNHALMKLRGVLYFSFQYFSIIKLVLGISVVKTSATSTRPATRRQQGM